MSWFNPSQEEAADHYYSSKRQYSEAASRRDYARRQEAECSAEKSRNINAINSMRSDKLNFEKRIQDIKKVVAVLDGGSGGGALATLIGGTIPDVISDYNSSAQTAAGSYREAIRCSDCAAADLYIVFRGKSVDEDIELTSAVMMFENEIQRLEQALEDLQNNINNAMNNIDQLTSRINSLRIEQSSCRSRMISSAYEMNHYRGYI